MRRTWGESRRGGPPERTRGSGARRTGGSVIEDLFREQEDAVRLPVPANDNLPSPREPAAYANDNAPGDWNGVAYLDVPDAGRGRMDLKRVGNIVHLFGTMYGRRVRESTHETVWARAEEYRAARVLALREEHLQATQCGSRLAQQPRKRTLMEAIKHYRDPTPVHRWQQKRHLSDDTVSRVLRFQAAVLEIQRLERRRFYCDEIDDGFLEKVAERTIRSTSGYSTFLRQVLAVARPILRSANRRWGTKQGCPPPSFELGQEPKGRDVVIQPHNAKWLVEKALSHGWISVAAVLIFGFNEGPRRKELFLLKWPDVDFQRAHGVLRDVKSRGNEVRDRDIDDLRPGTLSMLRSLRSISGRDLRYGIPPRQRTAFFATSRHSADT